MVPYAKLLQIWKIRQKAIILNTALQPTNKTILHISVQMKIQIICPVKAKKCDQYFHKTLLSSGILFKFITIIYDACMTDDSYLTFC